MGKGLFLLLFIFLAKVLIAQEYYALIYHVPFEILFESELTDEDLFFYPSKIMKGNEVQDIVNIIESTKIKKEERVCYIYPRVLIDVYKDKCIVNRVSMDKCGFFKYNNVNYFRNKDLNRIIEKILSVNLSEYCVPNSIKE